MVDQSTSVFLQSYSDVAPAPQFLTSLARPVTFDSQKVTIDIERDTGDVAIVIDSLQDSGRTNAATLYSNDEYAPPIYKEVAPLNSFSLLERRPGQNPHTNPSYAANLAIDAMKVLPKLENKIRRAVELQASQVLQTGIATLTDATGATRFTADYKPKATHFPTAAVSWTDATNAVPLKNLEDLGHVLHEDGRGTPNRVVFGRNAWRNFHGTDQVRAELDNRRIDFGAIGRPAPRGDGSIFNGTMSIGPFEIELWTYPGHYKDPQSGDEAYFVGDDNVIMLCNNTRLDMAYGSIPYVAAPESRALPFLPGRREGGGIALTWNSWITPDNSALMVSAGTRPLYIPVGIDTFGTLDTTV